MINVIKLSIDLRPDAEKDELVTPEQLASITSGCLNTLVRLGNLGGMIEVFRVTWAKFPGSPVPGPSFLIHFCDPLGKISSHSVDYRFMGTGKADPSAEEIADCLCSEACLPLFISRHLKKCKARLETAIRSPAFVA